MTFTHKVLSIFRKEMIPSIVVGSCFFLSAFAIHGWVEHNIQEQKQQQSALEEEMLNIERQMNAVHAQQIAHPPADELMPFINTLTASHNTVMDIFKGLSQSIPEGVYLDSFIRNESHLILVGVAGSALDIARLMKSLSTYPAFQDPVLVETQAMQENVASGLRFHLTVKTS